MDRTSVDTMLRAQSGVISRRQVVGLGASDNDIERALRRREWSRIHSGVYVDHTGPLTWPQRAWAGVLAHWPAGLSGESSLQAHGVRPANGHRLDGPIRIAVAAGRRVRPGRGVIVDRLVDLDGAVLGNLSPPRTRVEHALLTVASEQELEPRAVGLLADACQGLVTTPSRLLESLHGRPRLRHRALLAETLGDVASGAYSVLEHRYLTRVERPHGLPTGARQRVVRRGRSREYRDVEYLGLGVVVELDGRWGHELPTERWADLDRDLAAAMEQAITLRLSWCQALEPCRVALAVGTVLAARGWRGRLRPCGPACPAGR